MSATEKPVTELTPKTSTTALEGKAVVIYNKTTGDPDAVDGDVLKELLDKADSAYQKPGSGLPKSDLESDVQASLEKADAAAPQSNTYTKTEVDNVLEPKADKDTDAVEGNLAEFDANGNPVDSGIAKGKIAEIEGKVTDLSQSAGLAEGIADTVSAGTAQEIVFRKSGGDGVNYIKRFKGKTLVWNQMVSALTTSVTISAGHKYLSVFEGAKAISSSDGSAIAVTGGTDMFFDLTLMFGVGKEPSTVEEFEAMFPEAYYPYNAGELISNDAEGLETVGFNQWDEKWEVRGSGSSSRLASKYLIPVSPSKQYYFQAPGAPSYDIRYFGADGTTQVANTSYLKGLITIPVDCYYISFQMAAAYGTTYNHDICINLSDSDKNGTYEPYWKRTLNMGLNSFKVKDGQGNIITINGLKSAGSVYDEISNGKYIKRIGEVDLGDLTYNTFDVETGMFRGNVGALNMVLDKGTVICVRYITVSSYTDVTAKDKTISPLVINSGYLFIHDSAFANKTPREVKTLLSGVMLYYELATPVEYDLVEPIPNAILVDELGTERAVFPEHEDGSPSAPLCTDSNYSISVKNLIAKLSESDE